MFRFQDRHHAGRVLALSLQSYAGKRDAVVLALPRGGVPVGYEVAHRLGLPLDVFVVRKLGVPGHEELAMGALASGGAQVINDEVVGELDIPQRVLDPVIARERAELERREKLYRGELPPLALAARTGILVDDGMATGSSMRAAVAGLRQQGPARVVVAVPVGAASTCDDLAREVDQLICPLAPERFYAVGLWYQEFEPVGDREVRKLLETARHEQLEREHAAEAGP